MSSRNMVVELPVVLDVLSDGLENCYFLEKKAKISFVRETSNQHPQFFLRCSSDGSTPESRIMQVKEKHKYRQQNVIRFHLQGCCCVLKRPPTLPTSKDSHCNVKRFGNHAAVFHIFSNLSREYYLEEPGTVRVDKGTEIFGNSGKSEKKETPRKVLPFFRKLSTVMNRSIWIRPGIYENSIQMVSALSLSNIE